MNKLDTATKPNQLIGSSVSQLWYHFVSETDKILWIDSKTRYQRSVLLNFKGLMDDCQRFFKLINSFNKESLKTINSHLFCNLNEIIIELEDFFSTDQDSSQIVKWKSILFNILKFHIYYDLSNDKSEISQIYNSSLSRLYKKIDLIVEVLQERNIEPIEEL